jgi:hypothetical protein
MNKRPMMWSVVTVGSQQWTRLAVTGPLWLVVSMMVGLRLVVPAEVK